MTSAIDLLQGSINILGKLVVVTGVPRYKLVPDTLKITLNLGKIVASVVATELELIEISNSLG